MKTPDYIIIKRTFEDDLFLIIMLHKDGTINRKGDGLVSAENNLFIGKTSTIEIIEQLNNLVDPDFENCLNRIYKDPQLVGKPCELEIVFGVEEETQGTRFTYGSESMAPPKPILDFVSKAIELTNPWFLKQHQNAK